MGGRAFKDLHCPRISPDVYSKAKSQATAALQTVFEQVVVPTEMPEKCDYGDIDFLVSNPLKSPGAYTIQNFPWEETVQRIKEAFGTTHGRRGYLTADCMYFAVNAPCDEDYFIQIDVKVCFKPELFEWCTYELNYASNSKIIGSMVKPLGLTLDPEGIHIRVEDIEETDHHGSMVWVSKNPKDLLRIAGLDHRMVHNRFSTKEEIYQYFASSWLFHPAHFAARLAEEKYNNRIGDRSPHWIHFIKVWVPKRFPSDRLLNDASDSVESKDSSNKRNLQDLQAWYKHTRAAVRDKVFTMFPDVAREHYVRRVAYLKKQQEQRLIELLMNAIPVGTEGWKEDIAQPTIVFTDPAPTTTNLKSAALREMILPTSAPRTPAPFKHGTSTQLSHTNTIYIDPLPREPPIPCVQRPPPNSMSIPAKLACLARWTDFDPHTGAPYVRCSRRPKDEDMYWADAVDAGATEEVLVRWAKEAWWGIWARQVVVNYTGMWKRKFEKEDARKGI
ncbi:hypothetical protein yc1106_07939 [Curvularia clavata]|uniref:Uncharacterized protein n=1 Tax=Curvularia clavata TaxID=95742 RepID=A0A9Q9DW68_CURCL|nr:hypothetical protein yc1106_07939 [Curvularia clavata]